MIIREPLVQATYYYLREAPGDSPSRREDRHEAFVSETQRMVRTLAGWLAVDEPALPPIVLEDSRPPRQTRLLMETGQLQSQMNASAWVYAYALRNMLLLRIQIARAGEHEQSVWSMLDESLGDVPSTPSWLHTVRYWCGMAPRPPEDLSRDRSQPIQTPFGVLCLEQGAKTNLLVYPDARTESRANHFLSNLAVHLDWYGIQSQHCLERYETRVSEIVRRQESALDRVTRPGQGGMGGDSLRQSRLATLPDDLTLLERTYDDVLLDLMATRTAAQETRALSDECRLLLKEHALWDIAPSVWEARVGSLATTYTRIEADVQRIEAVLRRMDMLIATQQTRISFVHAERIRLLSGVVAVLGVLALLMLVVTSPSLIQLALRLLILIAGGAIVWLLWQRWSDGTLT